MISRPEAGSGMVLLLGLDDVGKLFTESEGLTIFCLQSTVCVLDSPLGAEEEHG